MRRSRSGGIVVIVALVVAVLAGFAALVLDLGYARLIHAQLRMAADAAALAAIQLVDGTTDGQTAATDAAVAMGANNTVAGEALALDGADVVYGTWDETSGFAADDDPSAVNAVQVNVEASVPVLLAAVPRAVYGATGDPELALSRSSLVVSEPGEDAGAVDCFLPFALGQCQVASLGLDTVGDTIWDASSYAVAAGGPGVSQMFMASPGGVSTFSAGRFRAQLSSCEAWGELAIDDVVALDSATMLNFSWTTSFTRVANAVNASTTTWDSDLFGAQPAQMSGSSITSYGNTLEGPIPVVTGTGLCSSSTASNKAGVVMGFLWGVVYDVKVPATSGTHSSATAGRIRLRIDTSERHEDGTEGGGPGWDVVVTADQIRFIEDPTL